MTPLIFSNQPILQDKSPNLRVWRPVKHRNIKAPFRKYNVKYNLPQISPEEYQIIQNFDEKSRSTWSIPETEYLLDLLQLFHGNFLLVHDRFDHSKYGHVRSVEDLKERVYFVIKLAKAAGIESMNVYYDKENEEIRKLRTERYMSRNAMIHKKEEEILTLIKDTTIKISKKEKEEANIRDMLELTCGSNFNDILDHDSGSLPPIEQILSNLDKDQKKENQTAKDHYLAFNRSSLMTLTVPGVSPILNTKLKTSLTKMGLEAQRVANEQNHDLFDRLKKEFIRLFVLKAYYEKKNNELDNLKRIEKAKGDLLNKRPST